MSWSAWFDSSTNKFTAAAVGWILFSKCYLKFHQNYAFLFKCLIISKPDKYQKPKVERIFTTRSTYFSLAENKLS